MTTVYEKAYAKLNLTLDVLGRRGDGYHDLKSVMQTISIHDDVRIDIDTGKPWKLICDAQGIPTDERNLAWKAARIFLDAVHQEPDGIEIRIIKRIPSGAGMGGGSSDAAAVLRALNRHYGSPFSLMELAQLGAAVGSDVPFCTLGGTAMAEGRGERLRKLPDMPGCIFVVCKPEFSVSTPELYRKIDAVTIFKRPDNQAMEDALISDDLSAIAEHIYNVFDPVVSQDHWEMNDIKDVCIRCGSVQQQMTGSGSAVFAIMPNMDAAMTACALLREKYPYVSVANPV